MRKLNVTAVAYLAIDAPDGRYDDSFVSNYALVNIVDELRRIPGVAVRPSCGTLEVEAAETRPVLTRGDVDVDLARPA